ncbi:MAG: molybdopterin-dependent oxidoreductase, partial [Luteitalea sp.]|nr:molybdopterin-dependent oxidoreductase [Luteitalea sp.]
MPRVTIDDVPYEVASGTLLDALTSVDRAVPALCHDARLAPIGMCRLCLVDVAGFPSPVAACATAVADGMQIRTRTPALEALRGTLLELLAAQYPAEAVAASPDEPFHRLLREYRVAAADPMPSRLSVDDAHPYIRVDLNRCIACMRCVRMCADVQGQFVWRVWERGDRIDVRPDSNGPLVDSGCVSCGACVDTCPTGALEDKPFDSAQGLAQGEPPVPAETHWTTTTCPYCGTGCEMSVGVAGDRIVGVRPVLSGRVSRGHLCVKGRYAFEFNAAPDRVTTPLIRAGGEWCEASWTEALTFAARRLQAIIDRDGPD